MTARRDKSNNKVGCFFLGKRTKNGLVYILKMSYLNMCLHASGNEPVESKRREIAVREREWIHVEGLHWFSPGVTK